MSAASPPWESLIDSMRVPVRGGERGVHKALLTLIILARAQRGGPANVFRFRDLDEPLRAALAKLGPARKTHRSEVGFWRLAEDGFWVVRDQARLTKLTGGKTPGRRLLLEKDAAAEVPVALWEALRGDPARVARLIQRVMARHWAPERHGEVLAEVVFDMAVDEDDEL